MRIALAGLALGAATGGAGRWMELAAPATERPPLLGESVALRVMVVVATIVLAVGWATLLRRRAGAFVLATFAGALVIGTGLGYEAIRPHPSSAFSGVIAYGPAIVVGTGLLVAMRIARGLTER